MDKPRKILLTGVSGYIGSRLLPLLAKDDCHVFCLVRNKSRIHLEKPLESHVTLIEADLCKLDTLQQIPEDIDAAYYLVHSMAKGPEEFRKVDQTAAKNFAQALEKTHCKQLIYLSGLVNDKELSEHLTSRLEVENILKESKCPLTTLRAGIIIGSGSASFEIIRDLVEKLPVMVAPKWVLSKCQPIALRDTLFYLHSVLGNDRCIGQTFDIGGPDIMTYRDMLLRVAKFRGLQRWIINVPVLTPNLSSYWLYFVTATNFFLARSLIDSLKNDAICVDKRIQEILPRDCLSYEESIKKAFDRVEENAVISSWKDSYSSSNFNIDNLAFVKIPEHGCSRIKTKVKINTSPEKVSQVIFQIGGDQGWYFMNWVWVFRGMIDLAFGGVGLRRGRTHREEIRTGDALDFWRVLLADKKNGRLLLFSEMKTPGEAWLELKITEENQQHYLEQIATFRPKGILGRLYWISLYPIHVLLFFGLCRSILKRSE